MKCPKCSNKIDGTEYVYCPRCGKKLELAGKREQSLRRRFLSNFILWFVSITVLFSLGAVTDHFFMWASRNSDTWTMWIMGLYAVIVIVGFHVVGADIIYHNAKRYGRNAVAWMTASILFTPILTAIAYGLTWPKTQQEEG